MLEVGKLYTSEEHFLMLYPDQKTAAAADPAGGRGRRAWATAYSKGVRTVPLAAEGAAYWSNRFGKPVSYTEKNIPLLVLNNEENLYEVLAGDRKGWIVYQDWLKIREIV